MTVNSVNGSTMSYHTLTRNAYDKDIITSLGGEAAVETSLATIWWLMMQQPNGPESPDGVLLANGYANIFYVRDSRASALRAVVVHWNDAGWRVYANELDCLSWRGVQARLRPVVFFRVVLSNFHVTLCPFVL
jgi:hypothetical protein